MARGVASSSYSYGGHSYSFSYGGSNTLPAPSISPAPSVSPAPSPEPTLTLADNCLDYTIHMYDSWGDGWDSTILYVGGREFTLSSGDVGTATACLYVGKTFEPYTCGGNSLLHDYVSWEITLAGSTTVAASGSGAPCSPSGSFIATAPPSSLPTISLGPTVTPVPTVAPTVFTFTTRTLRVAVAAWCEDPAAAADMYGDISMWDTSAVTDMSCLFANEALILEFIDEYEDEIDQYYDGPIQPLLCSDYYCSTADSFNDDISSWNGKQSTLPFFSLCAEATL